MDIETLNTPPWMSRATRTPKNVESVMEDIISEPVHMTHPNKASPADVLTPPIPPSSCCSRPPPPPTHLLQHWMITPLAY